MSFLYPGRISYVLLPTCCGQIVSKTEAVLEGFSSESQVFLSKETLSLVSFSYPYMALGLATGENGSSCILLNRDVHVFRIICVSEVLKARVVSTLSRFPFNSTIFSVDETFLVLVHPPLFGRNNTAFSWRRIVLPLWVNFFSLFFSSKT